MEDIEALIAENKAKLADLVASRPKVHCSSSHSSEEDVARETAIEDLEEEIRRLEAKQKNAS